MKKAIKKIIPPLFWIAVWGVLANLINTRLFVKIPTPYTTFKGLILLLENGKFYYAVLISLLRILFGFVFGLFLGCLLAFLGEKSKLSEKMAAPLLHLIRSVPVAAFIFMVYLWFSTEIIPVFISFLIVFPIIYENIKEGLKNGDKKLLEMARVFSVSKKDTFLNITLKGILPYLSSASVTSLGLAWKAGIAAEIICRPQNSVGEFLWRSKSAIDYDGVFAVTAVVVILSFCAEKGLKKLLGGKKNG